MTITEPATLITDYLLGGFTGVLAWRLFGAAREQRRESAWWWAVAFTATAFAGIAGGTVHGFQALLPRWLAAVLWIATVESLVVAAFAVIRATLAAADLSAGSIRTATLVFAAAYTVYGLWLVRNPQFVFAIAAYGIALGILVAFALQRWHVNPTVSRWMLAGVLVSVLAAVIQQSGWAIHRHFNHNDLFHVVQALGAWLLYQGARR